jgi:putative addiction module component (TIGR02574 family)
VASAADVLETALKLSVDDRARVAHDLIVSLDEEEPDPDAEALWRDEIIRRARSIDDGSADLIDGDEVHASVRAHLAEIRAQRRR